MDAMMSATVDATDPLVVGLTWALTWAAGRWAIPARYRGALPALAVLLAVAVRAGLDAAQGMPLTPETVARAVAAGGVAVMGHSQVREIQKALAKPAPAEQGGQQQ